VIKKAGTSTELVRRTVNSSSIACTGGNSDEYFTFSTDASTSAVDVRIEVIGSNTLTLDGISMRQSRSTCSIIHGNGSIYGSKQCDDGNTVSGDGCSATSQLEPGYTCTTPEVFVNGKMDQTLPSFTSHFVVDTTPVAGACGTRPTSSPREGTFLHSAAPQITCGCDEVFGMCLAFRRPATFIVGSPGYSLFRTPLTLRSNTIHTASLRYAAHSANGGGRARVNFTVVGGASSSTVTGESVAASPVKFQTVTSKFISAVASSGVGGGNYLEVFLPNTSYATDVVLDSISVRGGPSECRLVTGTAPGSAM